MAEQAGVFAPGATPSRQALQAAQARLMRDDSLQFSFAKAPAPPKPAPPPDWWLNLLRFLSRLFAGSGEVLKWVFFAGLAVALGLVLFFIVREIVRTRWPDLFKRRRKRTERPTPLDWRPDARVARALLEEADRLAAAGAYAEAAHLLLHRSIEDIERHRPRLVRPAFTSREIARLDELPDAARATFTHIAEVVERSFFGGRDVDATAFDDCRRAYEAFAFPGAWA